MPVKEVDKEQISKTEAVVHEFSQKIEKHEAKYQIPPIFRRERSRSHEVEPVMHFVKDEPPL